MRVGLVGLGNRASKFYLPFFRDQNRSNGGYALKAVFDPVERDGERPEQLLEFNGAALYHPDALGLGIRAERLDLVIVCSPDYAHYGQLVTTLRTGADAIAEKPVVLKPRHADSLLDLVDASGRSIQVAHNFRMVNAHIEVKRLLEAGVIGRVNQVDFSASVMAGHGASYFRRWHRKLENSGGIFVTKCCHHFDLVNWWLGLRPAHVFAVAALNYYRASRYVEGFPPTTVKADADIQDTMSSIICYEDGVHVRYSINTFSDHTRNDIKIFGDRGVITFLYDRYCEEPHRIEVNPFEGTRQTHLVGRETGRHSGSDARTLKLLFGGAGHGSERLPTLAESAMAIRIGDAINRSIVSGSVEEVI